MGSPVQGWSIYLPLQLPASKLLECGRGQGPPHSTSIPSAFKFLLWLPRMFTGCLASQLIERMRQVDREFEASLDNLDCLTIKKKRGAGTWLRGRALARQQEA